MNLCPPNAVFQQCALTERVGNSYAVPRNGVAYVPHGRLPQIFISRTEFDRELSEIVEAAKSVKTSTFPSTVREVPQGAFSGTSVRSAVLNEGLERLGRFRDLSCDCRGGVFSDTRIMRVTFPSTLKLLGDDTFWKCGELKCATFVGSRLEKFGRHCFGDSGLEEIALPKTLEEVSCITFSSCDNLKKIYVEDGSRVSISADEIPKFAAVLPPPETMAGDAKVWDLRK